MVPALDGERSCFDPKPITRLTATTRSAHRPDSAVAEDAELTCTHSPNCDANAGHREYDRRRSGELRLDIPACRFLGPVPATRASAASPRHARETRAAPRSMASSPRAGGCMKLFERDEPLASDQPHKASRRAQSLSCREQAFVRFSECVRAPECSPGCCALRQRGVRLASLSNTMIVVSGAASPVLRPVATFGSTSVAWRTYGDGPCSARALGAASVQVR
jgi:hypothetical protein